MDGHAATRTHDHPLPYASGTVRAPDIRPGAAHLRLTGALARGRTGRVDVAEDRSLLRTVAVKQLDRVLATDVLWREDFLAEARITGQLVHRNVIPVHEVGVFDDGVPYFTMDAVRGASFAQWLAAPSRAVGTAERVRVGAGILLEVCDAIAYAHRRGVIHRDLKPENVMVGDGGEVYVIDWGLARVGTSADVCGVRAAEVLGVVGTPTHMAPEQARGNPVEMDERCDVFGLGAMLYETLSGQTPYGDAGDAAVLLQRAFCGAVIPIEVVAPPMTPPALAAVATRSLAVDPNLRHPSADAFRADLHGALRERPSVAWLGASYTPE